MHICKHVYVYVQFHAFFWVLFSLGRWPRLLAFSLGKRGSINTRASWRTTRVYRQNRAVRREIAQFVGVEDDGVHWRRLMGVVVALANLRLGLKMAFN